MQAYLLEGLGLDLAYALARDAKLLAHLLKRVVDAVGQPMAHLQDLALLGREVLKDLAHLLGQDALRALLNGRGQFVVGDKVAKRAPLVVVTPDRVLE